MIDVNTSEIRALFQSASEDGANWLFVILPDEGWAITRNGDRIDAGTSNSSSIHAGVRKFRSFTTKQRHKVMPLALAVENRN
jgi:hypothetical protein